MARTAVTLAPHKDIIEIDNAFRLALIDKLSIKKQWKEGTLCNPEDNAFCCLALALRLEGATYEQYSEYKRPSELNNALKLFPQSVKLDLMKGATLTDHPYQQGQDLEFWQINDEFLSFKQLQELLRGNQIKTLVQIK